MWHSFSDKAIRSDGTVASNAGNHSDKMLICLVFMRLFAAFWVVASGGDIAGVKNARPGLSDGHVKNRCKSALIKISAGQIDIGYCRATIDWAYHVP
ncbi:hypothetical protein TH25_07635 [Thalassospira profundimaris]|uniref:Uncharacterized protein n=1 Tax=Thalassospira profundimaris TaxID=502049 RepID=A0A367XHX0_9PROT|nr:hypothetical protein TH25_07635 [Thalassospira profundimaris]